MIKIQDKTSSSTTKMLNEINVGTAFKGKVGPVEGVFIKSFLGTVHLANPSQTWSSGANAYCYEYREVDIVIKVVDLGLGVEFP